MKRTNLLGIGAFLLVLLFVSGGIASAGDVERIPKEALKSFLGSPGVIVVDVLTPSDYRASDLKIKGAVREDPSQVKEWMKKYSKDKTLVFYCA
jgi:rhodanese-related sulfurtransferase